ncbi:MAG: UDP-galactopyranose mutase Glf [Mucilaginibacter sp.]|nr:UDP-galactopyranose mutase Glf [Mucilaginibacter sp.]
MSKYDYLIVGSGWFGSVFAHEMHKNGKKCLVIDKRDHAGGNTYCKEVDGINIHIYGAHIFHTSNKEIWDYVNQFVEFNNYINSPLANYKGELYNLPFNMNTFYKLWGTSTPASARNIILEQAGSYNLSRPKNLEEQAIKLVGIDVYERFIKHYTEKQWGRTAVDLPASIIKRIPVRFTYNNNYYNDRYQGIPIGGYNKIFSKLLQGIEVRKNTDFFKDREYFKSISQKIVFTGKIDEYYDYCYGDLEYRSLEFEIESLDLDNYQGNAVVNFTDSDTPLYQDI